MYGLVLDESRSPGQEGHAVVLKEMNSGCKVFVYDPLEQLVI